MEDRVCVMVDDMADTAGAVAAFRGGVYCLKPLFLRSPDAFRPRMKVLVEGYLEVCELAGVEADAGLLGDVLPRL